MVTWDDVSFRSTSFRVIECSHSLSLRLLPAACFLCPHFCNYIKACLETPAASRGSWTSASIVYEILGILWVCNMVFHDSFICLLVRLLSHSDIEKWEREALEALSIDMIKRGWCVFLSSKKEVDNETAVGPVTMTPNVDLKSQCLDLGRCFWEGDTLDDGDAL